MSDMTDILGPSDARALIARHNGTHDVSEAEAEDYITSRDFWQDGQLTNEMAEIIQHLMVTVDPVGLPCEPSTADILSAWNSLRALKKKAMDHARGIL
jgi:hypothetical protein